MEFFIIRSEGKVTQKVFPFFFFTLPHVCILLTLPFPALVLIIQHLCPPICQYTENKITKM